MSADAFEAQVSPLLKGLGGFIRLKAPEHWEEVLQETLLAAWQSRHSFREQSSFKSWIYAIARYKTMDALRRIVRVRQQEEGEEALQETCQEGFEEQTVERLTLENMMSRLKTEDKSLLYLCYAQGFTLKEAADILGIPEGTVKSRLYGIRKKLREGTP